jgi:flagellin
VQTAIDTALATVELQQATVGALEQRLDFASNSLTDTILSVDEAGSNLADTDIASESTRFATETVHAQAAISIVAQTNNLQNYLLTLVEDN